MIWAAKVTPAVVSVAYPRTCCRFWLTAAAVPTLAAALFFVVTGKAVVGVALAVPVGIDTGIQGHAGYTARGTWVCAEVVVGVVPSAAVGGVPDAVTHAVLCFAACVDYWVAAAAQLAMTCEVTFALQLTAFLSAISTVAFAFCLDIQ